ncbi:MAG: hypothetical protein QF864_12500 [SAR202 cluster bacterium]|jgi:2-phospho-L-lactate guanylyltransferase|nr:hypothetical protein [SAR202 cluster bacterium]|tara:strand:- start:125 stop:751 length:627 start_codon:yes stop_codon:yes gene_type:complete
MQFSFSIILPIKNLNQSKTRLRNSLSNNKIKNLTLNLMDQTINVALEAKVSNVLIISSDKTIESKLTKDKVTFVYQEDEDLNKAIKNGFEISFSKNQIPIFLPCDLPLINKNNIKNIKNIMNKNFDVCIAPSKSDFGTNSLAWSNEKKELFYGFFGKNSYKKYTEYFSKNKLNYFKLFDSELSFDLDTPKNLNHLKKTNNQIYKNLLT